MVVGLTFLGLARVGLGPPGIAGVGGGGVQGFSSGLTPGGWAAGGSVGVTPGLTPGVWVTGEPVLIAIAAKVLAHTLAWGSSSLATLPYMTRTSQH